MKIKNSVKLICSNCYRIVRHNKLYIFCKFNLKHKQKQK